MRTKRVLPASLAVVVLSAITASTAAAHPAWKFNGTNLSGSEAVLGVAHPSTLSIPGIKVTCGKSSLRLTISNSGVSGKGEVTELVQQECSTGGDCIVTSIEAEKLPWPVHTVAVAGKNYVVIEGVRFELEFEGALCALSGSQVIVKGTAGGEFDNADSTLTFDSSSFTGTGTSLKAGASTAEWTAAFPLEALGAHRLEALEI